MIFTAAELCYLLTHQHAQRPARLATVGRCGTPQLRPVLFELNLALGVLEIGGWDMGATQKFRNVQANPRVSIVIDDVVCVDPFTDRGVEIRGLAQAIPDHGPLYDGCSDEIIRIRPRRIISWGLTPTGPHARDV